MSNKDLSNLGSDGLKLVSYCPLCETRYNPMQARVLGSDDETHLLHVTCQNCSNSVLVLVLASSAQASSIGMITDLSYEDVIRVHNRSSVSINDVIKAHEFSKNTDWESWIPNKHSIKQPTQNKKTRQ